MVAKWRMNYILGRKRRRRIYGFSGTFGTFALKERRSTAVTTSLNRLIINDMADRGDMPVSCKEPFETYFRRL